jgi:beta-lactamase superfamily II metal-dependent hydrolase
VRILALVLVSMLLLGCIGGQPQQTPQPNQTNVPNQTSTQNQSSVGIIVGPQQNQTVSGNATAPPAPPPSNQTAPAFQNETNATLGVYFIDVGSEGLHGSAILLTKGDMEVLIDAGPAENVNRMVDFLDSRGIDDIDLLISTSADPRNYGGISTIANDFRVEDFWWNGETLNDPAYTTIVNGLVSLPQGSQIVEKGTVATLNGVRFEVLSPMKTRFKDANNDAIVLRVTDRNFSMLLTSNIQSGAEGGILGTETDKLHANILQAPYYGVGLGTSSSGSFPAFLSKAKPDAVIITGSSDESATNGGSRDPFRALMTEDGIPWYETYVIGTLKVITDGSSYAIQMENGTAAISPYVPANTTESNPAPGTGSISNGENTLGPPAPKNSTG